LVAGRLDEGSSSVTALNSLSDHPVAVFVYFSTLFGACALCGYGLRRLLQWIHGPIKELLLFAGPDEFQARRFAHWSRVLSVDIATNQVTCTTVVASALLGSKSFLYAGLLKSVLWNESSGEPEWLELSSTMRRETGAADEPPEGEDEHWYSIQGESFMLRYSKVDTLNLIYSALGDQPAVEEPPLDSGAAS